MFPVANPSQLGGGVGSQTQLQKTRNPGSQTQIPTPSSEATGDSKRTREIKESECFLTSVTNLRKEVEKARHRRMFTFFFFFRV